jgi:hypothetical protein
LSCLLMTRAHGASATLSGFSDQLLWFWVRESAEDLDGTR